MIEMPDWIQDGAIEVWKVLGTVFGGIMAALGIQKWWAAKKAAWKTRWSAKADLQMIEQIHARIARHQKNNVEHNDRMYKAVLDLYAKHERMTDEVLRIHRMFLEEERRAADRFEALLKALNRSQS